MIMASRVVDGLASQGTLPRALAQVHPRTRTPVAATGLVGVAIVILALWLPLARLAEATSILTLVVFALVNLALRRLKGREQSPPGVWSLPRVFPALGFLISLRFVIYGLAGWMP